jgi:hypothetical protein
LAIGLGGTELEFKLEINVEIGACTGLWGWGLASGVSLRSAAQSELSGPQDCKGQTHQCLPQSAFAFDTAVHQQLANTLALLPICSAFAVRMARALNPRD